MTLRAAFEEWKVLTRSNIALAKVIELQHNGEISQQCSAVCFCLLQWVAVGKFLTRSSIALAKVIELQHNGVMA